MIIFLIFQDQFIMSPAHFDVIEHVVPAQYIREYPGALLDDQEDTLQLHIKQYKPKGDASRKHGGVTIVGAHANAFPKVRLRYVHISLSLTKPGALRTSLGQSISSSERTRPEHPKHLDRRHRKSGDERYPQ